jgi:NAD(P)-dependent dehydrogenase (short-subunit alcohol dehydrogenase family)
VFKEYRTLEILINGAGVIVNKPLTDVSVDDYEYLMDINLKGAYFACRQAIGNMLEHDTAGSIVNISSIGGLLGGENSSLYCASKAGLANLTRALAVEYGPEEIRVNAINPGPIKTALTRNDAQSNHEAETGDIPLRRMGDPQDIADVALFLASDAAAYVTGHNLVVDGGLTARY